MKRYAIGILAAALVAMSAAEVIALGSDLPKQDLEAAGPHCVHGFWVNETTVLFFAGDTTQLNRDLAKYAAEKVVSRRIVLHVGAKKAKSPWDKMPRDIAVDWVVDTFDDPGDAGKAVPGMKLRIDVWLNRDIKLDELRIPDGFEIVSGGEIEEFVRKRAAQPK